MNATGIKKAIFIAAIPALLIAIAWVSVNLLINPLLGYDRKTVAAFESIAVGQSKEAVLALMGTASDSNSIFHLSQKDGYESAYERASNSSATHYLFWYNFDVTYVVGFDNENVVKIKESGGS